jgi:hypothetical protein
VRLADLLHCTMNGRSAASSFASVGAGDKFLGRGQLLPFRETRKHHGRDKAVAMIEDGLVLFSGRKASFFL